MCSTNGLKLNVISMCSTNGLKLNVISMCSTNGLKLNVMLFPVYATTAANAHESSYACYFDTKRKAYLGDVYSVKWMEDSDKVQ